MTTAPTTPRVRRQLLRRVGRYGAAGLIALHGLVNLIGAELLWRLAEPGRLSYHDVVPQPGTDLAYIAGAIWLVAVGLFVFSAVRLGRGRPWRGAAFAAVVISIPLLVGNPQLGPIGLALDCLVGVLAIGVTVVDGTRARARRRMV